MLLFPCAQRSISSSKSLVELQVWCQDSDSGGFARRCLQGPSCTWRDAPWCRRRDHWRFEELHQSCMRPRIEWSWKVSSTTLAKFNFRLHHALTLLPVFRLQHCTLYEWNFFQLQLSVLMSIGFDSWVLLCIGQRFEAKCSSYWPDQRCPKLEYRSEKCSFSEWLRRAISLQVRTRFD